MKGWAALFCYTSLLLHSASVANQTPRIALIKSEKHDISVPQDPSVQIIERIVQKSHNPAIGISAACSAANDGVTSIVDASGVAGFSMGISSVCEEHGIPCISLNTHRGDNFTLNIMPSKDTMAKAVSDIVSGMDWSSYAILYDTDENLAMISGLLTNPSMSASVFRITDSSDISERLHAIARTSSTRIILSLRPHHLQRTLRLAEQTGLMTLRRRFLIISMDADEEIIQKYSMDGFTLAMLKLGSISAPQNVHQTLVKDAIAVITDAFRNITAKIGHPPVTERGICQRGDVWSQGTDLLETLKQVKTKGLTGEISFNEDNERTGAQFSVIQFNEGIARPVLTWNELEGVTFSKWTEEYSKHVNKVRRQLPVLKVHAILGSPYVMLKSNEEEDPSPISSVDRYEGLAVDILDEIAEEVGFDYRLELTPDGTYGAYDPNTRQWTGLVGDLVRRSADLAIGDFTITRQRAQAIDFTKPWRSFAIGLMGYRSTDRQGSMFSFLEPFTVELWLTLFGAFVVASLFFFIIARLSPIERSRPSKEEMEKWAPYTFLNSAWFIVTSLFRLTPAQQPRSFSVRVMSGFWYLFTLLVFAMYFASLVHFVTVKKMEEPIESIYDLANQNTVKYGAVTGGSTYKFFKESQVPVFQRIYAGMENMNLNPTNTGEGVQMVEEMQGNYAFFMEEPSLDYVTARNCQLKKIGGVVGPMRAYAFGLPKGSSYVAPINEALLSMIESGVLQVLYNRWIKESGQCFTDEEPGTSSLAQQLDVENLSGIFVILLIGIIVSLIIALLECCCRAAFIAKQKGDPLCGEVAGQMRQAIKGPPQITPSIIVTNNGE